MKRLKTIPFEIDDRELGILIQNIVDTLPIAEARLWARKRLPVIQNQRQECADSATYWVERSLMRAKND